MRRGRDPAVRLHRKNILRQRARLHARWARSRAPAAPEGVPAHSGPRKQRSTIQLRQRNGTDDALVVVRAGCREERAAHSDRRVARLRVARCVVADAAPVAAAVGAARERA